MNRQTKRMMQRQGQLAGDGSAPVPAEREEPALRPGAPAARPGPGRAPAGVVAGPVGFVRDIRGELRKVAWPTRDEVTNYSGVVIITLVLLVGFIFALNLAFSHAISALFGT